MTADSLPVLPADEPGAMLDVMMMLARIVATGVYHQTGVDPGRVADLVAEKCWCKCDRCGAIPDGFEVAVVAELLRRREGGAA